jgi:ACS family glucarate transporter-like MFS transporter
MYFTQTYGFTLYVTWLPTYLHREKHLSGLALSLMAGAPLLLSVIADLLGGLVTDSASARYGLRIGRCLTGGTSLFLAGLFLLAGTQADGWAAGLLIGCAAAFSNFLLGAAWAACVDLAGPHAGFVSAGMNTAGQVGGILSPIVFALLTRDSPSWSRPLIVTAVLYLFGALCWIFVHPQHPLISDQEHMTSAVGEL